MNSVSWTYDHQELMLEDDFTYIFLRYRDEDLRYTLAFKELFNQPRISLSISISVRCSWPNKFVSSVLCDVCGFSLTGDNWLVIESGILF